MNIHPSRRRLVLSCPRTESFYLLPVLVLHREPVYPHEYRYDLGQRWLWSLGCGWGCWHLHAVFYF